MFDSLFLNNYNSNFWGMGLNSFNFNNPFMSNFSNPFQFSSINNYSLFNTNFNRSLPFSSMNNYSLFSNFNSSFNTRMPIFSGNSNFFNNPIFSMFNTTFKTNSYKTDFNTRTDLPALKNIYKPDISIKLASVASKTAKNMGSVGWCYRGVKDTFVSAGLTKGRLVGDSAYEARDILRLHKNFKEVSVDKNDLTKLPAGCVIVWQPYHDSKGKWHKDGHIAVTLGNGKEASDHEQKLLIGKSYSVFVPVESSKAA